METPVINNKILSGRVVSTKMDKTVVVAVDRFVKHPKYGKYSRVTKKFKAHDPENRCQPGEQVSIKACRPWSKDKSFIVIYQ